MTIGILSTEFYLIDNWPGEVTNGTNPSGWTTASATEDFPLGTKRMVYDDTNHGWSTLMYLKFFKGTVAVPALAAGSFPLCGMNTAAAASGDYFVVNNDSSEVDLVGPMAICLASNLSANTYPYAWFWVGGVCPEDTVAALNDMAYVTDASVTAQSWMNMVNSASFCALRIATATDVGGMSAFSLVTASTS